MQQYSKEYSKPMNILIKCKLNWYKNILDACVSNLVNTQELNITKIFKFLLTCIRMVGPTAKLTTSRADNCKAEEISEIIKHLMWPVEIHYQCWHRQIITEHQNRKQDSNLGRRWIKNANKDAETTPLSWIMSENHNP